MALLFCLCDFAIVFWGEFFPLSFTVSDIFVGGGESTTLILYPNSTCNRVETVCATSVQSRYFFQKKQITFHDIKLGDIRS